MSSQSNSIDNQKTFRVPILAPCELEKGNLGKRMEEIEKLAIAQVGQRAIEEGASSLSSSQSGPLSKDVKPKQIDLSQVDRSRKTDQELMSFEIPDVLPNFEKIMTDKSPEEIAEMNRMTGELFPPGTSIKMTTVEDMEDEEVEMFMGVSKGMDLYPNGDMYTGEYLDDQPHGKGTMKFHNGDVYEGQMDKGKISGFGKIVFLNGDVYEGQFANGQINGEGRLDLTIGITFEGEFCCGIPAVLERRYKQYASELKKIRNDKNAGMRLLAIKESLRIELTQKAMAGLKESFEANRKSYMESNLTAEDRKEIERKKREEIDKIAAEFEREQAKKIVPSKRKGKSVQQPSKAVAVSSDPISNTNKNDEEQELSNKNIASSAKSKIFDPIRSAVAKTLTIHPRVGRWEAQDVNEIRKFADFRNGVDVQPYKDMNDHQIRTQRMRHRLPGVEVILGQANKDVYYTETDKGYRMMAALLKGGKETDIEYGDVCLGVNKERKTIYHSMFAPWPGMANDYMLLKVPLGAMPVDDKEVWKTTGACTWEILADRVIEFIFPNEAHRLRIFPLSLKK